MSTMPTQEGLWAQWGIDTRSPEAMLNERVQAQIKAVNEMPSEGNTPGSRATFDGGKMLGAALANWWQKKQGLTPDEQQQVDIREDANTAWKEFAEQPGFKDLDGEQKAHQYQLFMADAAFKNGRGGLGADIYKAAWEQKRARTVSDKNLEMLDHNIKGAMLGNEGKEIGNEGGKLRNTIAGQQIEANDRQANLDEKYSDQERAAKLDQQQAWRDKGVTTIWRTGSNDPNSGITAYLDGQGNAILQDGTVIPGSEFSTARPQSPEAKKAASSRRGAGGMTPSKVDEYRQRFLGMQNDVDSMNRVFTTLSKIDGSANFLGTAGETIGAFRKVVDAAKSLYREAGGKNFHNANLLGDDGAEVGTMQLAPDGTMREKSVASFAKRNPEFMKQLDGLAEQAGIDAAVYRSQVLGMAAARARSLEPNATALSEGDIKRAALEIGGTAGSISALKAVYASRLRDIERNWTSTYNSLPEGVAAEISSPAFWEGAATSFTNANAWIGAEDVPNNSTAGLAAVAQSGNVDMRQPSPVDQMLEQGHISKRPGNNNPVPPATEQKKKQIMTPEEWNAALSGLN